MPKIRKDKNLESLLQSIKDCCADSQCLFCPMSDRHRCCPLWNTPDNWQIYKTDIAHRLNSEDIKRLFKIQESCKRERGTDGICRKCSFATTDKKGNVICGFLNQPSKWTFNGIKLKESKE